MNLSETKLGPILEAVEMRAGERHSSGQEFSGTQNGGRDAFVEALRSGPLSILAEHKRKAPSAGVLETADTVESRCLAYAEQGASAISVLTEQDHFDGCLEHLIRASDAGLPRLRKDFILTPWMVEESATAGADAILLMAVCLEGGLLAELTAQAQELDMAVLCEIHDQEELERAVMAKPDCLGVNARDLRSFKIHLQTTVDLLPLVPSEFVKIAESGIQEYEQLQQVRAAGADAALVGTALMKEAGRLREWTHRLREEA